MPVNNQQIDIPEFIASVMHNPDTVKSIRKAKP